MKKIAPIQFKTGEEESWPSVHSCTANDCVNVSITKVGASFVFVLDDPQICTVVVVEVLIYIALTLMTYLLDTG